MKNLRQGRRNGRHVRNLTFRLVAARCCSPLVPRASESSAVSVGRLESFSSERNFLTSAAASPRAFAGFSREKERESVTISRSVPSITRGRESFFREEVTSRQLVDRRRIFFETWRSFMKPSVRSIDSRLTTPLPRPIVHQQRGGDCRFKRKFMSLRLLSVALFQSRLLGGRFTINTRAVVEKPASRETNVSSFTDRNLVRRSSFATGEINCETRRTCWLLQRILPS